MPRPVLLALEFSGVFVGIPLLIYYRRLPNYPIPYLLIMALLSFLVLRSDPTFDVAQLASWGNSRPYLSTVLIRDVVCLIFLGFAVRLFAPQLLFSLFKRSPAHWLLIFCLYPLLSVYPQELFYRAFFFHRYQPLFGSGWGMLLGSAFSFGFVHIIFRNWLAVGLCVIGGLLFSFTYQSSGSLLLACLDHALFGNFLFTIGLGQFFYHASRT
ncbi:MAG TPA: CPBP family intramembrane glutamic endopeptidase [Candidatus Acidoferrum sp.]|nr:CPBP family intramembrane glutamic endopeptidase [Candidatus Acidoferrum sp.]